MKTTTFNLSLALALLTGGAGASDWKQYRGPEHDGTSPEKIIKTWPKEGPPVLWKATLGASFGSYAVSDGRAFAFIQRKVGDADREVALGFDAATGKEIWSVPLGKPTYDKQGGDGPRSTPTVDGKRVYFLGAHLELTCLDAATGKQIWAHDIVGEFSGKVIQWNHAASPVVDGNLIFVNGGGAGQALLAFDKSSGAVVWKGQDDKPTHASPVPATIQGVRQVIFFTQTGLVSVAPANGQVLWRYSFPYKVSTAASPVVWQDIVYCSAGYGVGAGAVRVTKSGSNLTATELWRQEGKLMNHWSTPVCKDGYLYGLFGHKELGTGPLKCIELSTGREMWSQSGIGTGGGIVLLDGCLLIQCDRGPLVLAEATPTAYREIARAQIYGGQCWTTTAVSNGRLYARNTKEGVCLDVSAVTAHP